MRAISAAYRRLDIIRTSSSLKEEGRAGRARVSVGRKNQREKGKSEGVGTWKSEHISHMQLCMAMIALFEAILTSSI